MTEDKAQGTGGNGPGVPADRWRLGAGMGRGLGTFFGPITAGYGRTETGRGALLILFGN